MKLNVKYLAVMCIFFTTLSSCLTSSNAKVESESSKSDTPDKGDQLNLANNYARDGLLREAVSTYKKVLASDPEHLTARRNMGLVLVKIGDYKQAAANLEKVVQKFQRDFDTSFYYAESLRGIKKYADAIFWYKNSLLIKNDDEKALKALAWSYFTIKYYSEALKTARHMYKLNPKDVQSTIIISRTFLKLNRPKEALNILKGAKNNLKNSDPLYANLLSIEGEIHFAMNNIPEAKKLFSETLKLQPLLSSALIGLGRCQTETKQYKEAVELIERAIRIKPRETSSYFYLATAYEKLDPKKSIKFYNIFNKRAATDPEYLSLTQEVKARISALKED